MSENAIDRTLNAELFENYQSCSNLGLTGIRDSEKRLENYKLSAYLNSTQRVLDVGCNSGIFSLLLAPKVASVVGIEVHAPFVEQANRYKQKLKIKNCQFINSAFEDFQFRENSFDVVLSLASHFWMTCLETYIGTLKTIIASGGYLLIESHNLCKDEHATDWQTITAALKDFRVISEGNTKEELTYKRGSGVHKREFRLYIL